MGHHDSAAAPPPSLRYFIHNKKTCRKDECRPSASCTDVIFGMMCTYQISHRARMKALIYVTHIPNARSSHSPMGASPPRIHKAFTSYLIQIMDGILLHSNCVTRQGEQQARAPAVLYHLSAGYEPRPDVSDRMITFCRLNR